ncbi:MAG: hypothetical protein K9J37_18910 [Saprospiraceae bacterium]|nr:hypothetical protein [Saprospiraceae bacterium]MCF8251994.1 hypothetical protein [Saprospiraceae bacterium]MCF8281671.1 hypothetical protein [Bacteroidales bacterium]MCF8313659.1 hypothetical protein [Saprospiraceae bacterium]MCF8442366.1 hypothetical protein [Saprospiraceae bacterium]
MTLQEELMDIGKERLTQMKVLLDELQVQMALGKADAKDIFDRERKNFLQFVSEEKNILRRTGETASKHRQTLVEKCDTLNARLAKATAENKRQYDVQKRETLHAIYELELAMKEAYGDVGMALQTKLDAFRAKLDTYRIKLALGEFEAESELEPLKPELVEGVAIIQERLKKEVGAGEKIDAFSNEISTSFDHMKKAFADLLS